MSKEDVVNQLKERCTGQNIEVTKSDLSKIFDVFMEVINDDLSKKGEMRLHGIGTFCVKEAKEKQCRNPQNGQMITVPKKQRVKFKASQTLLYTLNKKKEKAEV